MLLKRMMATATALAAVMTALTITAGSAHADTEIAGTFNSMTPTRILDTRSGVGAPEATLAPGATLSFDATSETSGDVSSVALTVTAVNPAGGGWIALSPAGVPRPLASTLNFVPGRTTVNSTIVAVGTDGMVNVYNGSTGVVDVLADLTGWWTGGTVDESTAGALTTLTPARVLDTRTGGGLPLAGASSISVPILGEGGVPEDNVAAVVINLTVAQPTTAGYLTASAEPQLPDTRTSTLNFRTGLSLANLAVVPLNTDGTISIYNGAAGTAHVIVDVMAYVSAGEPFSDGAFVPSTAYRAVDTRLDGGPMPALTTRRLALFPDDGTASIFKAVSATITVASPQASGYLTAWDGVEGLPATSNNNFPAGVDVATTTILPVNPDGTVSIYNGSYGKLDVVIDVTGFVLNDLSAASAKAAKVHRSATTTGSTDQQLIRDAMAGARRFASR